MEKIISQIKRKPELNDLPDSLVEKTLKAFLSKNKIVLNNSTKERKIIIKEVRAELRRYAGQYVSKQNAKKRMALISQDKISELLSEHTSTRERTIDYDGIKKIIYDLNPKSILDLGCGLNPLAIAIPSIEYHAYDIKEEDLNIVREFFKRKGISGEIHNKDIRELDKFPKVDLCIIFKVLDILGEDRNKIARKLLTIIDSNFFIVSFATRTLSGKPMNSPYRNWFEKILKDLNYPYKFRRMNQEIIYIIRKTR